MQVTFTNNRAECDTSCPETVKAVVFYRNRRVRGIRHRVGNFILICSQEGRKRGIRHQKPDDRAYFGYALPLPYPHLHLRRLETAVARPRYGDGNAAHRRQRSAGRDDVGNTSPALS